MKTILTLVLLFCVSVCLGQAPVSSAEHMLIIQNVSVISVEKPKSTPDQTVVIKDGRIVEIGASSKVKYGQDAFVVSGEGKYLIPGLAEMHAHIPPPIM